MSKPLIAEFGSRYLREFFSNAYFQMDGKLMKFRTCDEDVAVVYSMDLNAATPKWGAGQIAVNKLQDFSSFKWPKLGYRQFRQGKMGNIVVLASSMRSTRRGLTSDHINWEQLPVYQAVDIGVLDGFGQVAEPRRAKEIFKPIFTPFSKGIAQMLAGELLAFAVSEDLAVGLSINTSATRYADIYYRGRVVGNVDEHGNINIVNKILQRESLKKKLFQ